MELFPMMMEAKFPAPDALLGPNGARRGSNAPLLAANASRQQDPGLLSALVACGSGTQAPNATFRLSLGLDVSINVGISFAHIGGG
jgi:hypothetical protein